MSDVNTCFKVLLWSINNKSLGVLCMIYDRFIFQCKKNPKNYLKSHAIIVKYKISLTLNMFLVNVNLEVNRAIVIIKT